MGEKERGREGGREGGGRRCWQRGTPPVGDRRRGAARAERARGTPTQNHISPGVQEYEGETTYNREVVPPSYTCIPGDVSCFKL